VRVPVFHPYTDAPEPGIDALAYAYEEVFGEKVRALAERSRPRDLYDVINLFRNADARPSPAVLLDVLRQKCAFKGITVPTLADIEKHRTELDGLWQNMLNHQLPSFHPTRHFGMNCRPSSRGWQAARHRLFPQRTSLVPVKRCSASVSYACRSPVQRKP
jgi:hypothetical protein